MREGRRGRGVRCEKEGGGRGVRCEKEGGGRGVRCEKEGGGGWERQDRGMTKLPIDGLRRVIGVFLILNLHQCKDVWSHILCVLLVSTVATRTGFGCWG